MKMANELFNITLKCDFRRSTHAHSPSQLKKNKSKNVDTSATKMESTWLEFWWGQPKQVTEQKEGLRELVLGLGVRMQVPGLVS